MKEAKQDHTAPQTPPLASLLTIRQTAGRYPFTEDALRALVLNASDRFNSRGEKIQGNGLDAAIIRCGRKVLLDEHAFVAWLARGRKTNGTAAQAGA